MPSEVPLGVVGGVANWHPVDHHSGYGHHYVALEGLLVFTSQQSGRILHCPLGLFIFVTPSFVTPSFTIPSFVIPSFIIPFMSRSVLSFGLFYT